MENAKPLLVAIQAQRLMPSSTFVANDGLISCRHSQPECWIDGTLQRKEQRR